MTKARMIAMQANQEEAELFDLLKSASMSRTDGEMIRVMMRECAKIFLNRNAPTGASEAAPVQG